MENTSQNVSSGSALISARRLVALVVPQWRRIAVAAACMVVTAATTAAYATLVGPVLESLFLPDRASEGPGVAWQWWRWAVASVPEGWIPLALGGAIVATAGIKAAAFLAQRWILIGVGQRILVDLRATMMRRVLEAGPAAPRRKGGASGDVVTRFTIDAPMVEQAVTGGLLSLVSNALQVVALVAVAVAIAPYLALLGALVFPVVGGTITAIGRVLRRRQNAHLEAYGRLGMRVEELVSALPVVASHDLGDFAMGRFDAANRALARDARSALRAATVASPLNEFLGAAALGGTLWFAHGLIGAGDLTASQFISFFTALFLSYRPVKGLSNGMHTLVSGAAALDRIDALQERGASVAHPVRAAEMEVRVAAGGYAPGQAVIRDVRLAVPPGRRVAVVGPSGCGKTTLLYAMAGFLPWVDGRVAAPGRPALVPAEPVLFDDTIAENLLCAASQRSERRMAAVCRALGVHDFVMGFPDGYSSGVGTLGEHLSFGQRQRIALARAVLSDAPVLLLDEATSGLDGAAEAQVLAGLSALLEDRIAVVVTHRRAPLQWADTAVVMRDGRVVWSGDPADLQRKFPDWSRWVSASGDGDDNGR